jgi:predicted pyridoxine 5'-phosphate oxidase superfamily flavin-nucleotide-binding protein
MSQAAHEGERAVQRRAGVAERTQRHPNAMAPGVQRFLAARQVAVLATLDDTGRVWASLRTGAPGFMRARSDTVLEIAGEGHPDDPLVANLRSPSLTGVLAIDLAARQRVRVNGTAQLEPDGRVVLMTEQVYGNCPQYIHPRDVEGMRVRQRAPARAADRLDDRHARWMAGADTFFLATALPGMGADASHRGGRPGFVHVVDERRLLFPDYPGNNYFNSLGNIASYPRAGLLVPDFVSGDALQVSGVATILWDDPMRARFPGAQRLVQIDVERLVELPQVTALRFGDPTETPALP